MQHQQEGVLYQGKASMGVFITAFLFRQRMRCMVCGDQVQPIVQQGFP